MYSTVYVHANTYKYMYNMYTTYMYILYSSEIKKWRHGSIDVVTTCVGSIVWH